jgi:hypothetical protein
MDAEPMPDQREAIKADIIEQEPVAGEQPKADISMALTIYQKVGVVPFDPSVVADLAKWETANADNGLEDQYDILPTGELYLSQTFYRRILNNAFGRGGWAMIPMDPKPYVRGDQPGSTQLVQEWALIAHGRFISQVEGGAEYSEKNSRQLWSDACETVRSNALMRLCKDLGLASDCWDRRYIAEWKKKHAVRVWVAKKYNDHGDWKVKGEAQWRRADADPLRNELRPVAEGETAINVREPKFGVFEIVEDVGDKLKQSVEQKGSGWEERGFSPKQAGKKTEKPKAAPEEPTPKVPADYAEQHPLLALAQRAGHNNHFTARAVTIVEMTKKARTDANGKEKKDGAGKVQYTYSAHTDHGEIVTTFSTTDATALFKASQEKRSVDINCKAVMKVNDQTGDELWFINLEEIVAEA